MTTGAAVRTLSWTHGMLQVHSLGGMFGPGTFLLPDGRQVSPFHVAPWWNEPESTKLDGLLRGLRGEWPCVPFGFPMPREDFPEDWKSVMDDAETVRDVHGFGSNHHWTFEDDDRSDGVRLRIDYPDDHDVEKLVRVIRPVLHAPEINIELHIHARRSCRLPVALHGCFALPPEVGTAALVPGGFMEGLTHPSIVEPGVGLFEPGRTFHRLDAVPGRNGKQVNAASLPFRQPVEELVQLNRCDGTFALLNSREGYRINLIWDAKILPSVLLWYSNRGRDYAPWSSRNLSIGIEPCCSAFGLAPSTSAAQNPIVQHGTPTAVALSQEAPTLIRYRIGVAPA